MCLRVKMLHLLNFTISCHVRLVVRRKSHFKWNCCTDFFCRLMNKTKIMKANTKSKNVVTLGRKPLEETDCFTYLGSKINKTGGAEEDTKARIQKVRVAFLMLSKIWKSKLINLKTKMRIFNSSVKSVLYYIAPKHGELLNIQ